jgi:hypothetical protein
VVCKKQLHHSAASDPSLLGLGLDLHARSHLSRARSNLSVWFYYWLQASELSRPPRGTYGNCLRLQAARDSRIAG